MNKASNLESFSGGVIQKQLRGLNYCVQEVGDTVSLPACTAHLFSSVNENESWNVFLSHNILHDPAVAAEMEIKCWIVTRAWKESVHQGMRGKQKVVTRKRFGARKHRTVSN